MQARQRSKDIFEDAETSLRDLQCEMVEMRSKLLRKDGMTPQLAAPKLQNA